MGHDTEGITYMTKDTLGTFFDIAGRDAYAHTQAKGLPGAMREDLTQEGLLWLLEHPERVEHARQSQFGGEEIYGAFLVQEIRRHYVTSGADRWTDDQEAYIDTMWTPELVELVFPAVYDPEYTPFREQTEAGERFAERDPSESGTWMAMIADVSSARDALGRESEWVRYVFRHAVLNESNEAIGMAEGFSRETARQRVRSALRWMADWLNGGRYEPVEDEE